MASWDQVVKVGWDLFPGSPMPWVANGQRQQNSSLTFQHLKEATQVPPLFILNTSLEWKTASWPCRAPTHAAMWNQPAHSFTIGISSSGHRCPIPIHRCEYFARKKTAPCAGRYMVIAAAKTSRDQPASRNWPAKPDRTTPGRHARRLMRQCEDKRKHPVNHRHHHKRQSSINRVSIEPPRWPAIQLTHQNLPRLTGRAARESRIWT